MIVATWIALVWCSLAAYMTYGNPLHSVNMLLVGVNLGGLLYHYISH